MRCFFLKDRQIVAVEFLKTTKDAERIADATVLFAIKGKQKGADGFEVWHGPRFLYRFQE